ncbi:MAG TPA: transporter substrate-binding domain-containing protein [Magnetospirillaceae bacterium]|nr:transporter substrate-binding domain-containing protein [Magnetospirillaceae bacterium]
MAVRRRLAALALCALLAGPALADQDLVLDADSPLDGLFAAVVTGSLAGSGLAVTFHTRPWARCFEEVRTGVADGLFAVYHTPERDKQFLFSKEPLYLNHEHVLVRRGESFDATRWRELLRGKRIGIVNGSYHGRYYEEAVARNLFGSIETVNSMDSLASMLMAGRIDAAFATTEQMEEASTRIQAIESTEPAVDSLPVYLAFTLKRDMRAARDQFDRGLRKMKEDGRYEALRKRFAAVN